MDGSFDGAKRGDGVLAQRVSATKQLLAGLIELAPELGTAGAASPAGLAVAITGLLSELPPVMSSDDVASLLRVDVKVVYAAVADLGLPMRAVGKRKCLRGLTSAILLWLVGRWPLEGVHSAGQGRVVQRRKGRR